MRMGLYIRVSTREQAREGYSIAEQEKRLSKYCEAKDWQAVDKYIDGGYSGGDTDRPALQRLLKDVRDGRIDGVLVYKLDRLSRSQRDTMELIEDEFLPNGVDFVSMTENLDTSTPVGMAMIGLLAVFAQLERSQIAERMAVGIEARAREGYWHGAACSPVGYDYVNGLLEVIPYEAMMVKEAFEEFAARKSIHAICRDFNEKGYRHRYGPFLARSVGDMLKNPLYAGWIEKDGELYPGKQDAIVPQELFDKVQRVMAERDKNNPHRNTAFKKNSMLGGLLHCKRCKARYCRANGHKKLDGTRSAWYSCYSRNKKSPEKVKDPNCRNKIWTMQELDNLVFAEITRLGLDPAFIEAERNADSQDERAQRAELLRDRIEELTEQISRNTQLYSVGGLDIDEVRSVIDPLTDERQKLRFELAALEEDVSETVEEAYQLASKFGDLLEAGDQEGVRFTVDSLVKRIEIDGDNVEIFWTFA